MENGSTYEMDKIVFSSWPSNIIVVVEFYYKSPRMLFYDSITRDHDLKFFERS